MNKKKPDDRGFVYSTDPDFHFEQQNANAQTLSATKQRLKIKLDSKQRAGKAVTLVEGFIGNNDDLQELGRKLKTFCSTGGSAKDGQIIIQGDQRDKVTQWLVNNGFVNTKRV